jgi:hypothetical protein
VTTNAGKRKPSAGFRRVNEWAHWHSGLNYILKPDREPEDLLQPLRGGLQYRIFADLLTWDFYRQANEVRVCDGLALHHYLDPDLLRMRGPDPYVHLDRIDEQLGDKGRTLMQFRSDLRLVAEHVRTRTFRCKRKMRDPAQSLTTFPELAAYLEQLRMFAFKPLADTASKCMLVFGCETRLIKVLADASQMHLWNLASDGEYDPRVLSKAEQVEAALRSRFVGLSKKQCQVFATTLRPNGAPLGRHAKVRVPSEKPQVFV